MKPNFVSIHLNQQYYTMDDASYILRMIFWGRGSYWENLGLGTDGYKGFRGRNTLGVFSFRVSRWELRELECGGWRVEERGEERDNGDGSIICHTDICVMFQLLYKLQKKRKPRIVQMITDGRLLAWSFKRKKTYRWAYEHQHLTRTRKSKPRLKPDFEAWSQMSQKKG